jgi:hypothetical protein
MVLMALPPISLPWRPLAFPSLSIKGSSAEALSLPSSTPSPHLSLARAEPTVEAHWSSARAFAVRALVGAEPRPSPPPKPTDPGHAVPPCLATVCSSQG